MIRIAQGVESTLSLRIYLVFVFGVSDSSLKTFLFAKYYCDQRIRGFSTTMRYINRHHLSIYLSVTVRLRVKLPFRLTLAYTLQYVLYDTYRSYNL